MMNDELEVDTHDYDRKIEIEKLIQMLLLSSDVGNSVSSDPQFVETIRKLSNLRLDELASLPQRIQKEEDSIRHKTEQLAAENYPIFLANANTSREVHREFVSISDSNANLISNIAALSGAAQTIFDNIGKNASAFRTSANSVQKYTQISEFLELPQLMETCIQNGYYQDALNILNHTKHMTKKYGRTVPIVRMVGCQTQEISGQLFTHLCKKLREPITLPVCLKVLIYLRQLEAFTEQELRLNFLQARGICIKDQLEAALSKPIGISNFDSKSAFISSYQQAEYKAFIRAMRRIEVTRVQLFDSITQYRAVFADEEGYSSKLPYIHQQLDLADISPLYLDESTRTLRHLVTNAIDDLGPCNEGSLFHSWLVRQIGIFLDGLSDDLNTMLNLPPLTALEFSDRIQLAMANDAVNLNNVDASVAFQQTHSIMTQALYFGRSFARIGCDFRAHLGSLFSRFILIYFETLMSNALTELSVVLELWPWELVEMSFLSSQSTEGNPEELRAPFEIARHPAIAFFCNRILSAFNGLRICCPVVLRDGILSAFIRTLNSAANIIVSAHKSRQLDSSIARSQGTRLASVFAYTAVPHLLTCLLEHIFGGDAASHLWQLHQENDETPTTSQLISRFSKEVCAHIFSQWAQLAHGPLREDQTFASSAENVKSDKTLQAENFANLVDKPLQNSIESKPSNNAQNETVAPLINSLANETVTNGVIKTLEEPILNSALIVEEELPKSNASISNQSPVIIPSTVVQSSMDQQTMPMEEEPQLPTITNTEKVEVDILEETDPSSEPKEVLLDKVAISEVPFESDEDESQPNTTSVSAVQSPLASECQLLSESTPSSLKCDLLKTEHQESGEPLSTSKSGLDEGKIASKQQLIERIEAEQAGQIALGFTTGLSSVVNSSDLKLEEPDEPNCKRDGLNYTAQSCSQVVNPEVSNKITDLLRTVGHDESTSMFMDQPDNVVNDSFNTENNSEVYNAEYSESVMKVENVKIEESFPDQVGGIRELSTIQNQINEEMTCNTGTEEAGLGNEEVLSKSELKASLDSLEVPNDFKIGNREKGNWEKIDADISHGVDGHKEDEGVIYSLNPTKNAELIDLGPSYTDLSPEYKEPRDVACIPGLSDAKLEKSEDFHEVGGAEARTQRVPTMSKLKGSICMDRDGSVWKEKKELSSDLLSEEGASRINDTLTQIEHSEANYFKTEILEEDSTQKIANSATQEQTSEDVNSPKFGVDQSVEPDESWQDGVDWGRETEIKLNNAKECKADVEPAVQPNLNAQVGSQEIEVKPEPEEVSPQKIFPEEDRSSSLLKVDHQGVGTVCGACGIKGGEGADIEVQGVKDSDIPPALQSAETITTSLSEKLDGIKRSSDCTTKSEVIDLSNLTTFVKESSEDTKISKETKVGIKQYAASETQEVEMEAGSIKSSSLMELPEEKQKSNFLRDDYQVVESAWDDGVNEWVEEAKLDVNDIEAKKNFTSAETVIPSEKSGSIEEFLDYHVKSGGTGPSDSVPSNKEILEDIPVLPNAIITTVLSKGQDEKKESLDYHARSEFIESTSTPSDNEISEEVEADNLDGWGKGADADIGKLENKGNVDHAEVTESAISPHNSGKAEITVASSEKFVSITSMKSDHNSLGEQHSKDLEKPSLLPYEFSKVADALDENNNALSDGANLDEIESSSGLIGKHPSDEHFSTVEIVGEEPEKAIFDDCECWEDDNWVEERDPTETLPKMLKSDLSDPIEQNTQAKLKLDLKVSDKKVENTYWDDDDGAWGEDPDRIKVVPKKSETNPQTPDEKNTVEELEIESTGWGGDENDWGDDVELPRVDIEINKSIADQTSPSTTSLFVPASNEGELEEKRYFINPDTNIGDSGTIPKDRSKEPK